MWKQHIFITFYLNKFICNISKLWLLTRPSYIKHGASNRPSPWLSHFPRYSSHNKEKGKRNQMKDGIKFNVYMVLKELFANWANCLLCVRWCRQSRDGVKLVGALPCTNWGSKGDEDGTSDDRQSEDGLCRGAPGVQEPSLPLNTVHLAKLLTLSKSGLSDPRFPSDNYKQRQVRICQQNLWNLWLSK